MSAQSMLARYMQLPYSLCAGVMLVNRSGLVCVGRRLAKCSIGASAESWQMPHGDMVPGEPVREAGLRVLAEALGTRKLQVLAEAPGWFTYELPAELIGVALQGRYCGQKQKWLAARFLGEDDELTNAARESGRSWQWVPAADVPRLAPPLQQELCEDVIATFAPLLPAAGPPQTGSRPPQPADAQPAAAPPWFVTLFG
jgi:putative (di)nucleoside polyphosphate hydrolase